MKNICKQHNLIVNIFNKHKYHTNSKIQTSLFTVHTEQLIFQQKKQQAQINDNVN